MAIEPKFFVPLIDERLKRIDMIKLEYADQDIIMTDSLLNDIFQELYLAYGYDYQDIINNLVDVTGYYDKELETFKIQIPGMLKDNHNLLSLRCALASKYMYIANRMLNMMQ